MEKVIEKFNKIINISILTLVIDLAVGILLVASTSFATKIAAIVIGSLLIIRGIYSIIRYIYDGIGIKIFATDLIVGISSIIIGLFSIFNTIETIKVIGILYGIWLLLNGCNKLYYSIKFMKAQEEIYPLITFISILYIVMSIIVIFNPFNTFMLITKLIGYFIIASSLLDIIYNLLFKKRAKEILILFK